MAHARRRKPRFTFPLGHSSLRRASGAGRLGMDLRAQPGKPPPDLDVAPPAHLRRRAIPFPWRRTPIAPRVGSPLPAAGDTVHHRQRFASPALIGLLLAQVLLVGLATWALTAPSWQVRHLLIQGTDDQTVLRAVNALPLTGCNIFRCDTSRAIRLVEGIPAVARADVHAQFPDTLVVVVTLRRPALLLRTTTNTVILAEDGVVLGTPASDPALDTHGLPDLSDPEAALAAGTALTPGARLDSTLVNLAAQLRRGVQETLGDGWTLHYTQADGFRAIGPGGDQVLFGTPRDAAATVQSDVSARTLGNPPDPQHVLQGAQAQLAELAAIRKALADHGQHAALIDLRWGGHPYVRLRD